VSLKANILNILTANPKLATFGIGFAITFAIDTAIGMVDHNNIAEAITLHKNDHAD
jgi:hypothetical protein